MQARGGFEVKMTPDGDAGESKLGRMSLDKHFHGDLEASSKGQMLTAFTSVQGSAGYVALERVTGTLHGNQDKQGTGQTGSFVLQHSGTMNRGAPQLTIAVVPDSGTEELAGLRGSMTIDNTGGVHSYVFDYNFSNAGS